MSLKKNPQRFVVENIDLPFCFLAFAVFYASFFPGILNIDATYQLGGALIHIQDWHSPVMTAIWAGLNRIYVGPALMLLVIQLGLFSGLYLILRLTVASVIVRCIGMAGLVLLPMDFPLFGYGMKDSFFCANLFVGFALVTLSCSKYPASAQRLVSSLAAMVFLFLAAATRPDGVAAVVPPLAWMAWAWLRTFSPKKSPTPSQASLLAISLFAAVVLAITFNLVTGIANTLLCEGWRNYPDQVVIDHDLAGISIADGELHFPPSRIASGTTVASLEAVYSPADSWAIFFPKNAPLVQIPMNHQKDYDELVSFWLKTIREHPFFYLQNRAETFIAILGLKGPLPETDLVPWGSYPNTFGNFPSYAAVHAEFSPAG